MHHIFNRRSLFQETLWCISRASGEIVFRFIFFKSTNPLSDIIRLIEQNLQVADIIRLLPQPCRQFFNKVKDWKKLCWDVGKTRRAKKKKKWVAQIYDFLSPMQIIEF
jgi:hypothetical protein